jgi:FdhD protein
VWDELDEPPRLGSKTTARIWTLQAGRLNERADQLATEEPLEIRLLGADPHERRTVAVTMRAPGADFELAAGFLYGEGVIGDRAQVRQISYCVDPSVDAEQRYNIVNVALRGPLPELDQLERHFYTTSACGVCGKASLESLRLRGCTVGGSGPVVSPELIQSLPDRLRAAQQVFQSTGGLHAAALFDASGHQVAVREDVGRHNAVDKLVGWALLQGKLPLAEHIVLVSGRSSYEILQKCLAAGVPMVCAVSAPSSLAVAIARDFGMTLIGFLRGDRFNIYAGLDRLTGLHQMNAASAAAIDPRPPCPPLPISGSGG